MVIVTARLPLPCLGARYRVAKEPSWGKPKEAGLLGPWLFREEQPGILAVGAGAQYAASADTAKAAGARSLALGQVKGERLRIGEVIDAAISELGRTWREALAGYLHVH